MSGLAGLSIDPRKYKGNFLSDLFWLTFYQQHLGEDYAGLSTLDSGEIKIRTHRGLFRPTFSNDLLGLEGTEGIGFCGPDREPFSTSSKLGKFSACFSGNLVNGPELTERFKSLGHTFERDGDDIEVITKLIAQGKDLVSGIRILANETPGAYALLLLAEEGIYASLCPTAHWPLVIGEKEGAVTVVSDSGGLGNLGFTLIRDLEPGETILIREGRWEPKGMVQGGVVQFCSFFWVYTGSPAAVFRSIPASIVRKRLGACHARRDISRGFFPDIAIPIPDSGRFHATGYHQEFCRQMAKGQIDKLPLYEEPIIKYPHAGRSFTPQEEAARIQEAEIKIVPLREDYRDLILVYIDDSLVRGTQTKTNLVPKLKSLGVKEIHARFSNPALLAHCPWGKTTKKGETLAYRIPSKEERMIYLEVDSLEYNMIDDLVEAIGLPREQLCVDCDLPPR